MKTMFPEYRELICQLRQDSPHFARLFEEHEELNRNISKLELDPVAKMTEEIDLYKRKKLKLKDEMYQILRQNQLSSSV